MSRNRLLKIEHVEIHASTYPDVIGFLRASLILIWHWKLGVIIYCVQEFMRTCTSEKQSGNIAILPAIINTKFPSSRNCAAPVCESCMSARTKKRLNNTKKVMPKTENEVALYCDKIEVGCFVSTDHFL